MKSLRFFAFLLAAVATFTFSSCSNDDDDDVTVIDFESIELPEKGYVDDLKFISNTLTFSNTFTDWGNGVTSWYGFAYSNCIDKTTKGWTNQYSVFGDGGYKSKQFAIAYYASFEGTVAPNFQFANQEEKVLENVMITNGTYAVLAIQEGESPAKKFEKDDWFKVIFTGYKADGTKIEKPVEFFLADFRNGKTDICKTWQEVNLKPLGKVNKVTITFDSSDKSGDGLNTPAYVCIDNLTYYND